MSYPTCCEKCQGVNVYKGLCINVACDCHKENTTQYKTYPGKCDAHCMVEEPHHHTATEPSGWEEEFANRFARFIVENDNPGQTAYPSFKAFIRQLLQRQKNEDREKVIALLEGMRQLQSNDNAYIHNEALSDAIERIRNL